MSAAKKRLLNAFLLLLCAAIWGLTFVIVDGADRSSWKNHSTWFVGCRFVLGSVVLMVVALVWPSVRREMGNVRRYILPSLVMCFPLALLYHPQTFAILQPGRKATEIAFLTNLGVVFVPILSSLFLRRKLQKHHWVATLLAALGIGVLHVRGNTLGIADYAALVTSVALAIDLLVIEHWGKGLNVVLFTLTQCVVFSLFSLGLAVVVDPPGTLPRADSTVWIALCYTGVLGTALAFCLQIVAQRGVSAMDAAIILSMEPLITWMADPDPGVKVVGRFGAAMLLIFGAILVNEVGNSLQTPSSPGDQRDSGSKVPTGS